MCERWQGVVSSRFRLKFRRIAGGESQCFVTQLEILKNQYMVDVKICAKLKKMKKNLSHGRVGTGSSTIKVLRMHLGISTFDVNVIRSMLSV